jgi:signal transduction histidine kinase
MSNGDILLGGADLTQFHNGVFSGFGGGKKYGFAVTAIAEERTGRLWLGNWEGAFYLENGNRKNLLSDFIEHTTVVDIYEQKDGTLWFATGNGLFRWQNNQMRNLTMADGLVSDNVKVIHESPDGTFWFGTYGGLSRFKDGVFTSFTTDDGLSSNQVRSLYEDADGVLWIGSYDGGLTRLKDGKFTRYTSNDGLFNDGVFQILEDERGNFWINSNRGIYRVSKQQLNDFADGKTSRLQSIAYGKADGLLETEGNGGQQPAGIKARDGKLWFPTQGGVAVIDPEKIITNPIAPPVLIESIALNGASGSVPNGALEISPDVENIQINYTGLSFVKPEQVRFRYRMDGLDSDWVEAGTRRAAYYSHLPAGEYDFTVIAANSDGIWNETGASLKVRVVPPFYRTFWFITAAIVVLFSLVVVFYQRRVERIERARLTQENFARQLIESQERERSRIAGELHDGLSQSLVIIKNRAVLSLSTPNDAERAFEQLEEISAAASEAMFEAKEMIYDLRPIQLDRFGLTKALKAMLKKVGEAHDIEVRMDIDDVDGMLNKEGENNLYRIAQELINNVVRHSRARTADVSIKRIGDFIRLEIADDGIGFAAEKTLHDENYKGGFGLLGVAERAKLLNGHAETYSAYGKGTIVKASLPIE